MIYAKIEKGIVVEYPLYEGALQERFPELQFPMDAHNTSVPDGYMKVELKSRPTFDLKYECVEKLPLLSNGKCVQQWELTELTNEEKIKRSDYSSHVVRQLRNNLLLESDRLVLSDRWQSYSTERKLALTTYRSNLRDITLQTAFPYDIVWPTLE
jgi:hypothetical protein